ncbi:tRNA wybutosine-synthesizing protein 5-like [Mytilus galloprovincialis]|uniref:tRNA wybutosine-synthesizing protein 5-like n=1 Tax=Mytilus galloprovincialis TaxID=29158 RepID=UPI003F7CB0A8
MTSSTSSCQKKIQVSVLTNVTQNQFVNEIYPKRLPVIIRGQDIGPCIDCWKSMEYLGKKGGSKEVKIHVSPTPQMDFINKNFLYRSLPFNELVKRAGADKQTEYFISETEKYYLRAVGDNPRTDIADINKQFPELAEDISIPPFFSPDRFFSSVFRISSNGIQLWTHYDVMDNILIQVTGSKRVVLFSPQDANYMYLNGDKSEVLDIDNPDLEKYPNFINATRYEGVLQAGDILFIPALWFHNVIALEFGIAVNVFWKHLDDNLYDNKDTYGNKDLTPASRAMQIMDRAMKALEELPDSYKDFYARRLITRIERKCLQKSFPP